MPVALSGQSGCMVDAAEKGCCHKDIKPLHYRLSKHNWVDQSGKPYLAFRDLKDCKAVQDKLDNR